MTAPALKDAFVPELYRVGEARRELADVVTLEILPATGARPACEPGQFNMLYVFGVGEVAISLSGDCRDETKFIHTVRDVGAVSGAITRLEPGVMLGLRGPFGTSWPVAAAEGADVVVVAGGLGLAPLRPAIYHLLANRQRFGRVAVLFGTRTPEDILFREELSQWRQLLDVQVEVTVDHAGTDWRGHVGVVPKLLSRVEFDPRETIALICGPEIMMRFTAVALADAGVPPERLFLSMERNMKCAIGLCGHCQFGPSFICKDGPVMSYDKLARHLAIREI
jgi:NAD(P)H-flavin reductase